MQVLSGTVPVLYVGSEASAIVSESLAPVEKFISAQPGIVSCLLSKRPTPFAGELTVSSLLRNDEENRTCVASHHCCALNNGPDFGAFHIAASHGVDQPLSAGLSNIIRHRKMQNSRCLSTEKASEHTDTTSVQISTTDANGLDFNLNQALYSNHPTSCRCGSQEGVQGFCRRFVVRNSEKVVITHSDLTHDLLPESFSRTFARMELRHVDLQQVSLAQYSCSLQDILLNHPRPCISLAVLATPVGGLIHSRSFLWGDGISYTITVDYRRPGI